MPRKHGSGTMRSQSVRRLALVEHAARWLQSLVDRGRRSDGLLQTPQTWEAQYAAGRWDFLAELSELARFSVLAGYIWHLKPGGAVLDVGCGQGALLRRLQPASFSRYVGIDVSASAISVAQKQQSERGTFLVADCENYAPVERFDVIVFNEVLPCLPDPLHTVERYTACLNPAGLLLVSLCTAARGSATILRRLKQTYATADEVRVVHSGRKVSWLCAALRLEGSDGRRA
ncbi:MAG TPA: methyltransferase domain-containing protein [Steroidobacteraceae bacterium]|nr:methyltransferase domain-containing protein [Steroidobacteraceae bacterium]